MYLPTAVYGGSTESFILQGTGDLLRYGTSANTLRMTWEWPTDQQWPTTLPGTAG